MQYKKIQEFEVDDRIDGFYIIRSIEKKTASNGNNFLDITLSDNTGEINAKLWDLKDSIDYEQNMLIKVRGDIVEWQGKKQLKIIRMRSTNESDGVKIEDYIQSAPYDSDDMYNSIYDYITKIKNDDIKKLVDYIIKENYNKLLYYPAAKQNHHAIRSGLLYHILRMLMTAEKLTQIYDYINRDLLYAGIILHDIAKVEEMDANELGVVSDYTVEGQLLGHIIQGIKNIDKVAMELKIDREISILLQHMILSHHYHPEFGSPKKPMIPEAELLHYIDMIDARMYDMEKHLKEVNNGEFTNRVWSLENRKLYRPTNDQLNNYDEESMTKLCTLNKEEVFGKQSY
ncbi:3'-5' exoribonuclease YhaM [Gottschalkia purinilytica]|uniref:3'-5' exoribonuclease YhaM n=1 Tax=Gottschalkia purinilytica TaxID=1503 RepID=A0A0L0WEG3_GOTPU|nr:HD domain-containing protein [Gottschalkia purinilytica]KNF09868.1 3'-5' exoribonuclease YhaM [Gottschalkia purinilytica]